MANNNVKNEQVVVNNQATPAEGQVQQQVPTQEIPVMMVQQVPQQTEQPQKENWFKAHWKGILAGASAVAAAVGSGFVAYHKGKNVGMQQPMQPMNDYSDNSLNPNI